MPVYFYPLMLDGMARKDQRHTHTHYSACIATDDGSDYSAQALSSKKNPYSSQHPTSLAFQLRAALHRLR
jgi:hypothetical protein